MSPDLHDLHDLQNLRQQLRERFPEAHREEPSPAPVQPSSALPAFPSGSLSELSPAGPAAGLSLVLAELLQAADRETSSLPPAPHHPLPPAPKLLALIDGRDSFDPASYGTASCARLLWIRCHHAEESLRCTDLLLRDGNLPLLVLDLQLNPLSELRKIPTSSWYRLRTLAKQSGAALLIFTPRHLVPCASLQLTFHSAFSLTDLEELRSTILYSETERQHTVVNAF